MTNKTNSVTLRAYTIEQVNKDDLFSSININETVYTYIEQSRSAQERLQEEEEKPYSYVISFIKKDNNRYFGALFTLDNKSKFKFISDDILKQKSFSVEDVSDTELNESIPSYYDHFYFLIKDSTLILNAKKFKVFESHFNHILLASGHAVTVNVYKKLSPSSNITFKNIDKIIISDKDSTIPKKENVFSAFLAGLGDNLKIPNHRERLESSIRKSVISCEIYHPAKNSNESPKNEIELSDILRLIDDEYGDVTIITKDGQHISSCDHIEAMHKVDIPIDEGKLCEKSLFMEMASYEKNIQNNSQK